MEPQRIDELKQIVTDLNSRKRERRELAERRLRDVGRDSVQELLSILAQERQKRKKRQKIFIGITIAYMLTIMIIAIVAHAPFMIAFMGSISGMMVAAFAITQAQKSITLALAQLDNVQTVGALVETLEYHDKEIVQASETALIRLLPHLKASDTDIVNTEQRAALTLALNRKNPDLIVAILQALEQVGDSHALPAVQRLAAGAGWAAKDSRIRAAAQECLPALMQHSKEERSRQTLLRASSGAANTATPSDLLLRPASGAGTAAPHELLRSSIEQTEIAITEPETAKQTVSTAASYTQLNEEPPVVTVGHQGQVV